LTLLIFEPARVLHQLRVMCSSVECSYKARRLSDPQSYTDGQRRGRRQKWTRRWRQGKQ
jgi:hypothetical protein